MAIFYKGVGVGTFLHGQDLRATGITAWLPAAAHGMTALMRHVVDGTTQSPYISLTRSYGVARDYALDASRTFVLSAANPAWVYQIDLDDDPPDDVELIDPVCEVAANVRPFAPLSYHHNGDMDYILSIVDPVVFPTHLITPAARPAGNAAVPAPPRLSDELQTMVRALRDAEVLAKGAIPAKYVTLRHSVP